MTGWHVPNFGYKINCIKSITLLSNKTGLIIKIMTLLPLNLSGHNDRRDEPTVPIGLREVVRWEM